jgi:hypothetical protein
MEKPEQPAFFLFGTKAPERPLSLSQVGLGSAASNAVDTDAIKDRCQRLVGLAGSTAGLAP